MSLFNDDDFHNECEQKPIPNDHHHHYQRSLDIRHVEHCQRALLGDGGAHGPVDSTTLNSNATLIMSMGLESFPSGVICAIYRDCYCCNDNVNQNSKQITCVIIDNDDLCSSSEEVPLINMISFVIRIHIHTSLTRRMSHLSFSPYDQSQTTFLQTFALSPPALRCRLFPCLSPS